MHTVKCGDCGFDLTEWRAEAPCEKCGSMRREHSVDMPPVVLHVAPGDQLRWAMKAIGDLVKAALQVEDFQKPTIPESDEVLVKKAYAANLRSTALRVKRRFDELGGASSSARIL